MLNHEFDNKAHIVKAQTAEERETIRQWLEHHTPEKLPTVCLVPTSTRHVSAVEIPDYEDRVLKRNRKSNANGAKITKNINAIKAINARIVLLTEYNQRGGTWDKADEMAEERGIGWRHFRERIRLAIHEQEERMQNMRNAREES